MIQKIIRSKWFTLFGIIVVGAAVVVLLRREPALQAVNQEQQRIDEKMSDLERQQSDLEARKEYFQSTTYLELQARLKLNYKKPDENVVYVYHKTDGLAPAVEPSPSLMPLSFWKRMWYYLTGK